LSTYHAINLRATLKELSRITKPSGKLVIIDKPIEKFEKLEIDEWEQWIDDNDIQKFNDEVGEYIEIVKSVPYEGKNAGLFRDWIVHSCEGIND
jgi:malonyl-CoA O-methyltransferase